MSVLLQQLEDDRLYLFVFGPGFGETTLMRVPPDTWIVIDSFRANDRAAASRVLSHYGARADLLVLTHPHVDHALGFIDLIEQSNAAQIGCLHPSDKTVLPNASNDPLEVLRANARRTYDRITQEWERSPNKRWHTFRGQAWKIPDGTLVSLHPKVPTSFQDWTSQNFNDLSSAMILEWKDTKLLLGADVTNESGCWKDIASDYPNIADHTALKMPHHGSQFAVDACYGNGDPKRCWLLTPYSKGKKLPRFENGEGIEKALTFVEELSLTALPYRHNMEHQAPLQSARGTLHAGFSPQADSQAVADKMERGLVVGFSSDGSIVERRYGKGTVRITA